MPKFSASSWKSENSCCSAPECPLNPSALAGCSCTSGWAAKEMCSCAHPLAYTIIHQHQVAQILAQLSISTSARSCYNKVANTSPSLFSPCPCNWAVLTARREELHWKPRDVETCARVFYSTTSKTKGLDSVNGNFVLTCSSELKQIREHLQEQLCWHACGNRAMNSSSNRSTVICSLSSCCSLAESSRIQWHQTIWTCISSYDVQERA